MAAYLKTSMPFYGVQKPGRVPIVKGLAADFAPPDRAGYEAMVDALWELPHREEKYVAIGYAKAFPEYIDLGSMPLYERLIVDGAWWDLVDDVAIKLVGGALEADHDAVEPVIRSWISHGDLWLRRTSIICQVGHKSGADVALLGDACAPNLADTDFFIRKAIGWALRDHARTDPAWVRAFVDEHRDEMSGLSVREATKHL